MRRAEEIAWVCRYIRDVESDFSAIHRIDDIWSLEAGRFFHLATRLPAYQGAVRMRAETQAMNERGAGQGGPGRVETEGTPRVRTRQEVAAAIPVGSGELDKLEGLGITQNNGDGLPWLSIEKATD